MLLRFNVYESVHAHAHAHTHNIHNERTVYGAIIYLIKRSKHVTDCFKNALKLIKGRPYPPLTFIKSNNHY